MKKEGKKKNNNDKNKERNQKASKFSPDLYMPWPKPG